jgi:DNA invertase Pin-like site-specific DNA recombinase
MNNFFSYARISTKEANDKQSFNRQTKSLEIYAKDNGINYLMSFKDDTTGATFNRKEWDKLDKIIQSGDTIIFKEISRFTREAEKGYSKYMDLLNREINLIFIDNPTLNTDYIKKLSSVANSHSLVVKTAMESIIKLLLIVELDRVQQEREIIVKRIKQGIEASEKKSGREKNTVDKMTAELETDIKELLTNRDIKHIEVMKKHNISRNTLKKYIEMIKINNQ